MKSLNRSTTIIAFLILIGCSPTQKPIEYGADNCAFCDMTIIDNRFSAELVTNKNKVYKFDAIECMIRYNHRNNIHKYSLYLISDYNSPNDLINAANSTFLISNNLPSPMGAYLSGYFSIGAAKTMADSVGGRIYNWTELNNHFSDK